MTPPRLASAFAALPLLFLTGCVSLGASAAPPIYRYALAYPAPQPSNTGVAAVLRVAPLRSTAIYDRTDIVYRASALHLDAYNYRRWAVRPARMIGDLLERDLVMSESFKAVIQGPSPLVADYVLDGVVEAVEEHVDERCSAYLRIRFLLARSGDPTATGALLQRIYEAEEACGGDTAEDFVEAMSRALASISERLRTDLVAVAGASLSGSPR